MQETGLQTIEDYIRAIDENPQERLRFVCLMAVSISRFFRDRQLWQTLQSRILPILAGKKRQSLRVWSAGCASGEEPYTFRMIWECRKGSFGDLPRLSMLATDLCPEYLERAKEAVYPPSSVREVPEQLRSALFEKSAKGKYSLKSRITQEIAWRVHDFLSDPPGTAFDLVFLRNNLLTYYEDELKLPALKKVIDSVAPEGFLIIGTHERVVFEPADLKHWEGSKYIFQKRP